VDLIPYVDSNVAALRANALQVNPQLRVFEMSCRSGAGVAEWCDWLREQAGGGGSRPV
jgi:hydrogenase nickel incorporation protein HypB